MFRKEKEGFIQPCAEIKEIPKKGRCVFATKDYEKDELIERAPSITCSESLLEELRQINCGRTIVHDYVFNLRGICHFGLGWTSMYNHSSDNNAHWKVFNETSTIEIRARAKIYAGDEITIRYTNFDDMLWFEPV